MRLRPERARAALSQIDPGRLRAGWPVGLRDGALVALVAAGLSAVEISQLRASAITNWEGRIGVRVDREGVTCIFLLPGDLAAHLVAWLSERRIWATEAHVFIGPAGPLTQIGVLSVLNRYRRVSKVNREVVRILRGVAS